VNAARTAQTYQTEQDQDKYVLPDSKLEEMKRQEKILKLERELEREKMNLTNQRKEEYQKTVNPEMRSKVNWNSTANWASQPEEQTGTPYSSFAEESKPQKGPSPQRTTPTTPTVKNPPTSVPQPLARGPPPGRAPTGGPVPVRQWPPKG